MAGRTTKNQHQAGDPARLLLAASRERFSVAAADLDLPEGSRLTEWQRVTASSLITRLVRSIEEDLRAVLAHSLITEPVLNAALVSPRVEIALPMLDRAHMLRDPELGALLVRRAEEHRHWKEHSGPAGEDAIGALLRDEDGKVAAEAMAYLIARSRRFDRFHDPVMGSADLPAELHQRLVWMIAAALRSYLVQQHGLASGVADAAISAAAAAQAAAHDEGQSLEASAMRLAQALSAAGRLDGVALADLLDQGQLGLFIAGVALICGVEQGAAWEVLCDPRGRGAALLLRAGGVDRSAAARIFLAMAAGGPFLAGPEGDRAALQLEEFDSMDGAGAAETLILWRADPGYRAAIARLSTRARSRAA